MTHLLLNSPYNPLATPSGGLNFLRRGELAEHLGFLLLVVSFAAVAVLAIGQNG
jgi:hypothetical protein